MYLTYQIWPFVWSPRMAVPLFLSLVLLCLIIIALNWENLMYSGDISTKRTFVLNDLKLLLSKLFTNRKQLLKNNIFIILHWHTSAAVFFCFITWLFETFHLLLSLIPCYWKSRFCLNINQNMILKLDQQLSLH